MKLPQFGLNEYKTLIEELKGNGYHFRPVSQLPNPTAEREAYLRHDIDFFLHEVDKMAEIEASLDVQAVYYILLSQPYNPLYCKNKKILRQIVSLGHDIGLHYDLSVYPRNLEESALHLKKEIALLSDIIEAPIKTIAPHLVYKNKQDPFLEFNDLINPYNTAYHQDLMYISDSCRAWRDESLLQCFTKDAPKRLMLTIHPELWLNSKVKDRFDYLNTDFLEKSLHHYKEFLDKDVRGVWQEHEAPKLDAQRKNQTNT